MRVKPAWPDGSRSCTLYRYSLTSQVFTLTTCETLRFLHALPSHYGQIKLPVRSQSAALFLSGPDSRNQGVTKRCHLSWLTISALVYEGGGGLWGLSHWVQLCIWSPNNLWRSNSILNLCQKSYNFPLCWKQFQSTRKQDAEQLGHNNYTLSVCLYTRNMAWSTTMFMEENSGTVNTVLFTYLQNCTYQA